MHGGKALVEIFSRTGVDYVFSSPGTEWPPVWEAFAELQQRGVDRPRYINCRHEALAVAIASGYTKITGKPQAVLLHATAGPLNAAMFLRAAYQERVPMVICLERSRGCQIRATSGFTISPISVDLPSFCAAASNGASGSHHRRSLFKASDAQCKLP